MNEVHEPLDKEIAYRDDVFKNIAPTMVGGNNAQYLCTIECPKCHRYSAGSMVILNGELVQAPKYCQYCGECLVKEEKK